MSNLTETILAKANALMATYGISSVTMDDIAKECHISKRTLYEQIPDKRTLVWQCILYDRDCKSAEAQKLVTQTETTLEALLHIYRHVRENLEKSTSVFYKDMHRLYPELAKKCREMHREQAHSLSRFLSKGVEEGMFRDDINFEMAADVFLVQSTTLIKEYNLTVNNNNFVQMLNTAFKIFLRGIATKKGLEIIDNFFTENNI